MSNQVDERRKKYWKPRLGIGFNHIIEILETVEESLII